MLTGGALNTQKEICATSTQLKTWSIEGWKEGMPQIEIINILFALMLILGLVVGDIPFGASIDLNSVRVLEWWAIEEVLSSPVDICYDDLHGRDYYFIKNYEYFKFLIIFILFVDFLYIKDK